MEHNLANCFIPSSSCVNSQATHTTSTRPKQTLVGSSFFYGSSQYRVPPSSFFPRWFSSYSSACLSSVGLVLLVLCGTSPYFAAASRRLPSSLSSFSSFSKRSPLTTPTITVPQPGVTAFLSPASTRQTVPCCNSSTSSFSATPPSASPSSSPQTASFCRLSSHPALAERSTDANSASPSSSRSALERLQQSRDNVSQPVAQMLYEDMLMGRLMEDMCAQMYYRGKVAGFVHLYNGQEAVSTGVLKTLRPDDYCVSTYRDHVHALSKGVPPREVFAELYGKQTGCSKGRGGSMHLFSKEHGMVGGFAYIGEQVPVALGFAYSSAYRRFTKATNDKTADQVTVCFTGDGSTNMGQFYEAMNLAAVAKLPIIFVVENNNWAIGMAHYRSTSVPEIYKKAEGFGIPGVEVDGMDVLAVRKAAREAVDRARRGDGPSLIEALTYRYRGHSLADPDELRAPLERRAWAERDPLVTFAEYMKKMGYATDDTLAITKKKTRKIVDDAVQFAEASNEPVVEDIGKYIFGKHYEPAEETLTPEQLQEYAKALEAELQYQERRKGGDKTPLVPVQFSRAPLAVID
eukprot:GHVS01097561.1.p1 GENE.GHVS01097561.1~~GHVS01097561.1.p1  ORF type:complete len:575 (+),score=86.09 GHVS01097561.1:81-1805(+)